MSRKPLTYDWNGHTNMPISFAHLTDLEMASRVRMLMRSDLNHEGVVVGARDRIMALSKRVDELEAEATTMREFIGKAQGVALGVAMSGAEHPNPDEVLMDIFTEGQAILFPEPREKAA